MSRCSRCRRALKDPASVQRGFGPICWAKNQAEKDKDQTQEELPLLSFEGDIVCKRTPNGIQTNVPHQYTLHSPDGFEWGYGGSGPADFALNILLLFTDKQNALRLYQDFKWQFVSSLPYEGGIIKGEDIRKWLELKLAAA